jgi:hypothetical protein
MAQVIEYLPRIHKILSSNSSTTKKRVHESLKTRCTWFEEANCAQNREYGSFRHKCTVLLGNNKI